MKRKAEAASAEESAAKKKKSAAAAEASKKEDLVIFNPISFLNSSVEVERAWARGRRPGPNFWLAVNEPQARDSTYLNIRQNQSRLELGFYSFY